MFSYKLDISYDGTNFHGFQKQSDNRTIQGDIEKVLSQLLRDYDLTYSGRTDAGVHARSQILCLKVNNELKDNFLNSFNSLISNQIKINKIQKVSKNFHPRFDAKSRVYKYFILNKTRELPFSENRVYFVNKNLNINDLNSVSRIFLGKNNFKNFSKLRPDQTPERIIAVSKWSFQNSNFIYTIEGNSFLHNMVKSIVGSQLAVIDKKISIKDLELSLKSPFDKRHNFMVPSSGLYLWKIKY